MGTGTGSPGDEHGRGGAHDGGGAGSGGAGARGEERARKPAHVLTREDRSKGGTRSATNQGRDEFGQFAGRRKEGPRA